MMASAKQTTLQTAKAATPAVITKIPIKVEFGGPDTLVDQAMYNQALLVMRAGIATDEEWVNCKQLIDNVKQTKKDLETIRVSKTDPFNEFVKSVNGFFRGKIDDLTTMADRLGEIYIDYHNKREAKRLQEEADAATKRAQEAKAAQEAQTKAAAQEAAKPAPAPEPEADLFDDEAQEACAPTPAPPRPVLPVAPPPAPPKAPEPKKAAILTTWYPVFEDPAKVPEKYKVPSEKLVMDAFNLGIREIPGVRFEAKQTVRKGRSK